MPNPSKAAPRGAWLLLAAAFVLSAGLKLSILGAGAPYITIDDDTAYEAGFLVWYGHAAPQRMYLESWLSGASSIATHLARGGDPGLDMVTDAFRAFKADPDPFVRSYRLLMLLFDLATAWLVFLAARRAVGTLLGGWAPAIAASAFLLAYNTIWCYVVARPDTVTTFLAALGLWLYLRSEGGARAGTLAWAGAAFGAAGGMKLHALLYVALMGLDLVRLHGLRGGVRRAVPPVLASVAAFAVASGLPLFDPLKYVKLRLLNAIDDKSPWIQWGEQFLVTLRGAGWLAAPLVPAAAWALWRRRGGAARGHEASIVLLAVGWLVLFLLVRVLRAYWMLPALPLFFMAALVALDRLLPARAARIAALVMVAVLGWQAVAQRQEIAAVPFDGLRQWVRTNVGPDEPFYIDGFEALNLPRGTACLAVVRQGTERIIAGRKHEEPSFTRRHILDWEEGSSLVLQDMLNDRFPGGWTYYSAQVTPLGHFGDLVPLEGMRWIMLQQKYASPERPAIDALVAGGYDLVAEVTGPGGGGRGLGYRIYQRREAP